MNHSLGKTPPILLENADKNEKEKKITIHLFCHTYLLDELITESGQQVTLCNIIFLLLVYIYIMDV